MLIDLSNHVVVITGAGRGIGRVVAETFIREGSTVVAVDVSDDDLSWVAEVENERVLALACDVRDFGAVSGVVDAVHARYGRIDVLVNNAGINLEGLLEELDSDGWASCFDVNVTGVFHMCKAVIPGMKEQGGGRIINAASFAAIIPSVGSSAYAASKAAVVQLTRTLAGELGPWGITANAYAPGMIPTAINGFTSRPEDEQSALLDTLSLRRWGAADDVADVLCFLASDASRYITGTLIDVSGGKLATQIPRKSYELAGT